jgi:hypothetical protein
MLVYTFPEIIYYIRYGDDLELTFHTPLLFGTCFSIRFMIGGIALRPLDSFRCTMWLLKVSPPSSSSNSSSEVFNLLKLPAPVTR